MPARYSIDQERRIVYSSAWDVLTYEDCLGHQQALLADPRFDPTFSQLIDFTAVTHTTLTTAQIRGLAVASIFAADARRVMVTPSPFFFGLGRMFSMMREIVGERGLLIVRTHEEAVQALGLTQPEPTLV